MGEPQKDLNQINHVDVDHNGEHKPISEKNDVASSSQDSVSTNHESPVLPESSVSSSITAKIETNMNVQPMPNDGASAPGMTAPVELPGIMKPDIVFFGEGLGDEFHKSVAIDKDEVDLLIMIGSSLKVRPVALIPSSIAPEVPQILINREPLSHLTPDVELLGDCDGIINQICLMLGEEWEDPVHTGMLSESQEMLPDEDDEDDNEESDKELKD